MAACTVCSSQKPKYKCPRCYNRYCSVACCKAHKDQCQPTEDADPRTAQSTSQGVQLDSDKVPAPRKVRPEFTNNAEDEDRVSEEMLGQLGESTEVMSCLANPHLRAMMENLVNSDQPDRAMAAAMQEPIFTQFSDACLRVVDSENPNLEPDDEEES